MKANSGQRSIGWAVLSRFVRKRALGLIALVSVLKLAADFGADWVWWLETPVHFQPQYAVTLALSLVGLAWACGRERRFTRWDGIAMAVAVLVGGHAAAVVFAWTPAQRALVPPKFRTASAGTRGFRILTANVHSDNERHEAVLDLVRTEAPELVVLLELDSRWESALQPLDEQYPFHRVLAKDRSNFGIGVRRS